MMEYCFYIINTVLLLVLLFFVHIAFKYIKGHMSRNKNILSRTDHGRIVDFITGESATQRGVRVEY